MRSASATASPTRLQSGYLYTYALVMLLGLIGAATWAIWWAQVSGLPLLSILIALPLVAGVALPVRRRPGRALDRADRDADRLRARHLAVGRLTIPAGRNGSSSRIHAARRRLQLGAGIDGIALLLIVLTVFLMPICIVASWRSIEKRVPEYMAAFLLMEALMIGVFAAQDLFLFYIFFEGGLIPMYLIIGIWGGAERIKASYKFFLYTLLGSVLMLIAMICMVATAGTTSIPALMAYDFPPRGADAGCGSPSSPASRSSCRCGRSTPGCPTRTCRRRPRAR